MASLSSKSVKSIEKPLRQREHTAAGGVIIGGGEMGDMIRRKDWSKTTLGGIQAWPEHLRVSLNIALNTLIPACIWWGKDAILTLYNDAFKGTLGNKHPNALGRSARDILPEIWDVVGSLADKVFKTGQPISQKNVRFVVNRYGHEEVTYFSFSYSPIFDGAGTVSGLFCSLIDTTEEVMHRQELQESEARFRDLADTAPMYIAMANETGDAVYFNKPWLRFTGKKIEEMLGLGWLSTLHPDDAPTFEKDFKHAFKKQIPINKEYRFKRADGEYRWMLAIGTPRFTPDGHFSGYFGTYTDFHDLKTAQLALQDSEERFRTLIEQSPAAIQMVSPEGKILFTSDSVKNVLGYTPDELANSGLTPYLHPEDIEYFFENFNDLLKNPNRQVTLQYRVKHKDGSWAWLETMGINHLNTPNINALVGNFRNITKQKEAEDKLRDSEQRFRALAENIPNLAWMAKADGFIYWYNNRWYEYTGTTPENMEGWGWQSVHDPKYLSEVVREWKYSIKSGKAFEMVFPLKGADNTFRPFLTRVVPLHSADGKIVQWIGTNTDISEQIKIKEAEAEKAKLELITRQLDLQRQELIGLNKAKDEFISLASHQLRTPATGVKQFLGMLIEGYGGELTPEQMRFAKRSYESNEREITIINDLLKVAQIDAGKMKLQRQKVDIAKLIQEILDEQHSQFNERNQEISYQKKAGQIIASVDKDRLRMVLENLVDNASKYTPARKKIVISLSKAKDNSVKINIKDEGVGIPKQDIDKIFNKFVRIDNQLSVMVGGSGLGLYLVKKIVDLHDGRISVRSTLGKGTVFTLSLPA